MFSIHVGILVVVLLLEICLYIEYRKCKKLRQARDQRHSCQELFNINDWDTSKSIDFSECFQDIKDFTEKDDQC